MAELSRYIGVMGERIEFHASAKRIEPVRVFLAIRAAATFFPRGGLPGIQTISLIVINGNVINDPPAESRHDLSAFEREEQRKLRGDGQHGGEST